MKKIVVSTWVVLMLFSMVVSAQDSIENRKIDFLISSVENLNGAKFIRNGLVYNGKEAGEHLRMKRRIADGKVVTADDFISLCASKSIVTGMPYQIRLSDGKIINSEDYFREELKKYYSTLN